MKSVKKVEDNEKVLELFVSDDSMKLFVKAEPRVACTFIKDADLIREISSVAGEDLLDHIVIKDIAKELRAGKGCEERRVAKGIPATAGRDGKLVWLVRRFTPGKNNNDRQQELTDFFSLGLFENTQVGREIGRVYKPTVGTSGRDVLGKELFSAPGKPFVAKIDASIKTQPAEDSDSYDVLVAAIDGYVHEEGGAISVRNVLQLSGSLDYAMGHIDFIGGVKVGGDVLKGFHIKARGPIEIGGSVLGDNILKSESSITVKEFHNGGEKASVSAGGTYTVGVAQSIACEVRGHITVQREARDCQLRSLSGVFCDRGAIVGGTVWCVRGFEGATIGNEVGARTTVELRNELEVTLEYKELNENIERHEAAMAALELHIGPYLKNRKRVTLLNPSFRSKMQALINKYDTVKAGFDLLVDQAKVMRESKARLSDARINVTKGVFAGVILSSGNVTREIKDSIDGKHSFKLSDDGESWIETEFKPLTKE